MVTFGSNLGRRSRIGRLGGSPATANLGLPGVKKGKTWVGKHLRGTRNALVVLWRWFGAPSATLVGDGGSAAAGNADELALGGSEAGVRVCGFSTRAPGHVRARWG